MESNPGAVNALIGAMALTGAVRALTGALETYLGVIIAHSEAKVRSWRGSP